MTTLELFLARVAADNPDELRLLAVAMGDQLFFRVRLCLRGRNLDSFVLDIKPQAPENAEISV